jgi:CMP-N,N'-diacetyllegionaminic acid synthase
MKILFTICGRAGSKGIKNKNIRQFLGAPLPYYSLAAVDLYLCGHPDTQADIVLNTDSGELTHLFDINKLRRVDVIRRSAELSTDAAPKIAVIYDCLARMQLKTGAQYDMVVDLDITSPLRTVQDIANLIQKQAETRCDVAFSVTTARRNPYFNMVKKTDKGYKRVIESQFNTRQEAPEIFDMNASMYAYAPAYLRQQKGVLDGYCEAVQMYDTGVLDLDHENDFELMEVVGKYLFENKQAYKEIRDRSLL